MSEDASARLRLPYLAAGQLQKHVTVNEALARLDSLTQIAVASRSTTVQPSAPVEGMLYILPEGAEGEDWATRAPGDLVRAESGGWIGVEPPEGCIAVVLDEPAVVVRHDGGWSAVSEILGPLQNLARLGLNTTADAGNPFAARLNKALWTALEVEAGGDGDLRFTFNKQTSGDVLSLLFQSGWGGRAEAGLIGDEDFTLKVSPDGGAWHEALRIDRNTGRAAFAHGAVRRETTVLTTDGEWPVPAWARWVEVVLSAGGGGGGAGMAGPASTVRHGGGGGGAGGVSYACWPVEVLEDVIDIVVGGGGVGATAGAGVGANGGAGGDSTVASAALTLLKATGGQGGRGGVAASGLGGGGGDGIDNPSNAGGASSSGGVAEAGRSLTLPSAAGGGGGGGALSALNAARGGGVGGSGAALGLGSMGGAGGSGTVGGAGSACPVPEIGWAGGGGGGGGAAASGAGHAGGAGGGFGAGGGGGGAGVAASGRGGDGAPGVAWVTAVG